METGHAQCMANEARSQRALRSSLPAAAAHLRRWPGNSHTTPLRSKFHFHVFFHASRPNSPGARGGTAAGGGGTAFHTLLKARARGGR